MCSRQNPSAPSTVVRFKRRSASLIAASDGNCAGEAIMMSLKTTCP